MKASLKRISYIGATASLGIGTAILIKGMQKDGKFWLIIAGVVTIFSGVSNIMIAGTGIYELFEKWIERFVCYLKQIK